ncbi:hypothetical protein Syun_021635 [Stephania yunnanensis]|uniref:FAD/NAD(P)-binding domain-containing protein n=1 Tax=Stephania yunnanensis TaxID=152371 RepID=A0AAP0IG42_9MAGN
MAFDQLAGGEKVAVLIGGRVAGAFLPKSLQFHANVVFIDPKEYFEIPRASLRAMVEPSFAKRCVVNHNDYFRNGRIVISYAVNITDNSVFIADGNQITYDYLVVALGHNAYVPKTMTERLKQYEEGIS